MERTWEDGLADIGFWSACELWAKAEVAHFKVDLTTARHIVLGKLARFGWWPRYVRTEYKIGARWTPVWRYMEWKLLTAFEPPRWKTVEVKVEDGDVFVDGIVYEQPNITDNS